MLTEAEFYQIHLDRVSRSFAFCIRQLPDPLRAWVGLSYLTCRILDTIEDAPWSDREAQFEAFRRFDRALNGEIEAIANLKDLMPEGVESNEMLLLEDAESLLEDVQRLPRPAGQILRDLASTMSAGMQHFAGRAQNGRLELGTLAEVNQYCFFVAGIVGELLTRLLAAFEADYAMNEKRVLRAHHFGLFLQKVNLLKDQVGDEKVGRFLIPDRDAVEASAREHAVEAFAFLTDLPQSQPEFRRFCTWSLMLGLEAVKYARESRSQGHVIKVPRARTEELIGEIEGVLDNPDELRALFDLLMANLGWDVVPAGKKPTQEPPEWLKSLYRGELNSEHLAQLVNTN